MLKNYLFTILCAYSKPSSKYIKYRYKIGERDVHFERCVFKCCCCFLVKQFHKNQAIAETTFELAA